MCLKFDPFPNPECTLFEYSAATFKVVNERCLCGDPQHVRTREFYPSDPEFLQFRSTRHIREEEPTRPAPFQPPPPRAGMGHGPGETSIPSKPPGAPPSSCPNSGERAALAIHSLLCSTKGMLVEFKHILDVGEIVVLRIGMILAAFKYVCDRH